MRKIDLRPYDVPVYERGEIVGTQPYKVKESLASLAFISDGKIEGRELLKRDELARKIEESDDYVLLEESDWQKLVKAMDVVPKGRSDVELVRRLLDAPTVEVEVKHGKNS